MQTTCCEWCYPFVPTGDWSQFFVMPGSNNTLSEGNYVVYLDLSASKDASGVELTMQNGWGASDQAITVKYLFLLVVIT